MSGPVRCLKARWRVRAGALCPTSCPGLGLRPCVGPGAKALSPMSGPGRGFRSCVGPGPGPIQGPGLESRSYDGQRQGP